MVQGFFYWSGVVVWSLIAVGIVLASWFTIAGFLDHHKDERRARLDILEGSVLRHEEDSYAADSGLPFVSAEEIRSRKKRNESGGPDDAGA